MAVEREVVFSQVDGPARQVDLDEDAGRASVASASKVLCGRECGREEVFQDGDSSRSSSVSDLYPPVGLAGSSGLFMSRTVWFTLSTSFQMNVFFL